MVKYAVPQNPSSGTGLSKPLSRRVFFALLIAAVIVFLLRAFRRNDLPIVVQNYFGFDSDIVPFVRRRFEYLRNRNPVVYRDSVLFFGFHTFRGENWLHSKLRSRVISTWIVLLFHDRTYSWPYVHYPAVGEAQICNGLIRQS